ncbi:MAG: c-type cytochrome [Thermodesulfobacteriota bacterium]
MRLTPVSAFLIAVFFALPLAVFAGAPDSYAGRGNSKKGAASFATLCASCHGAAGKGDGIAAAALNPKPRDLSNAAYLSTLTDEYLLKVITQGGAAVGKSNIMPPWGGVLGDEGAWNVIEYLRKKICKCKPAS